MSRKKLIITAIVLVLILAIGGMLAYFTDVDTANNKFKLGNVNITVDEPVFNAVTKNANNEVADVMPGQELDKDPVITNNGTSKVYVFAEVTIPKANVLVDDGDNSTTDTKAVQELFDYTFGSGWTELTGKGSETNTEITYVLAYGSATAMTELAAGDSTSSIFTNDKVTLKNIVEDSTVAGTAASVQGSSVQINVVGKGIQKDGLPSGTTAPADIYDLI